MSQKPYNYFRPNAFRMAIQELPEVSFTCQSVNLPWLSANNPTQATPFIDIPRLADKLTHDDLRVSFIVKEDLSNYIELYNWLVGITFPNDYNEFGLFVDSRTSRLFTRDKEGVAYSDITVSLYDSDNINTYDLIYKGCIPKFLQPTPLDIKSQGVEYVTCDASFDYSMFSIKQIS